MDYIKRNKKAILKLKLSAKIWTSLGSSGRMSAEGEVNYIGVQLLQNSMDAPKSSVPFHAKRLLINHS